MSTNLIRLSGKQEDLIEILNRYVAIEVANSLVQTILDMDWAEGCFVEVPMDNFVRPTIVAPNRASSQDQDFCGQTQPHPPHVWAKGHMGWYTNCSGHS